MGKKNRRRRDGDGLSPVFGKEAHGKPVSKYAQKMTRRRMEKAEEIRVSHKTTEAASGAASRFGKAAEAAPTAAAVISGSVRRSTTAMVTAAYAGAGSSPARFGPVSMEPVTNHALRQKPCFLHADKKTGQWEVTRYTGDLSADGGFSGQRDSVVVGPSGDFNTQRTVFNAMVHWAKSQNPHLMDRMPQQVFASAQQIYGLRPGQARSSGRRFEK